MKADRNILRRKLASRRGASITFALLLFLVCATIGAVVLVAGTSAAGRLSKLAETDQRYYAVQSAAQFLREEITSPDSAVEVTRQLDKVTVIYTHYVFSWSVPQEDGSDQEGWEEIVTVAINPIGVTDEDAWMKTCTASSAFQTPTGHDLTVLKDAAEICVLGTYRNATEGSEKANMWKQDAVDLDAGYTKRGTLSLQTGVGGSEVSTLGLEVAVKFQISQGQLLVELSCGDYAVSMVFYPEIKRDVDKQVDTVPLPAVTGPLGSSYSYSYPTNATPHKTQVVQTQTEYDTPTKVDVVTWEFESMTVKEGEPEP